MDGPTGVAAQRCAWERQRLRADRAAGGGLRLHCRLGPHAIGVEYLARQLPTQRGAYFLPHILVFELGVFPADEQMVRVGTSNLELVRNGKSYGEVPTDPEFVKAAMLHPEWVYENQPQLIGVIGAGAGTVILGPDIRGPRFPGDPRAESDRPMPIPNPTPRTSQSDGGMQEAAYTVIANALPRHLMDRPTSGYVYFSYQRRLKKLKKIELRVRLDEGSCSLAIDPRNISRSLSPKRRGQPASP